MVIALYGNEMKVVSENIQSNNRFCHQTHRDIKTGGHDSHCGCADYGGHDRPQILSVHQDQPRILRALPFNEGADQILAEEFPQGYRLPELSFDDPPGAEQASSELCSIR